MTFVVEQPGPLSLIQDAGRPGLGHLGVTTSGAFDRTALRQVNALLGNDPGAAAIEVLGGGLVLRAEDDHVVAQTGAAGTLTVDGRHVAYGRPIRVSAGERLTVGASTTGLRAYVGVSGGWVVPTELGSASTDTLAGLGPAPLSAGDELAVGPHSRMPDLDDLIPTGTTGDLTLRVILGPRDDWFTREAVRALRESSWEISPESNRIGVRLHGPELRRTTSAELPSEPCLRGSIQVAADGQPIVFGPDHPVTGGYPVIAVVTDADTDLLAQAQPGRLLRFRRVG